MFSTVLLVLAFTPAIFCGENTTDSELARSAIEVAKKLFSWNSKSDMQQELAQKLADNFIFLRDRPHIINHIGVYECVGALLIVIPQSAHVHDASLSQTEILNQYITNAYNAQEDKPKVPDGKEVIGVGAGVKPYEQGGKIEACLVLIIEDNLLEQIRSSTNFPVHLGAFAMLLALEQAQFNETGSRVLHTEDFSFFLSCDYMFGQNESEVKSVEAANIGEIAKNLRCTLSPLTSYGFAKYTRDGQVYLTVFRKCDWETKFCIPGTESQVRSRAEATRVSIRGSNESSSSNGILAPNQDKLKESTVPEIALRSSDEASIITRNQVEQEILDMCSRADPIKLYSNAVEIGSGGSATVYRAQDSGDKSKVVAIKDINLDDAPDLEHILNEIKVMQLGDSNLVQCYGVYAVQNNIWVVMEFLGCGSFRNTAEKKSMDESQIALLCREVLKALSRLHKLYIVHSDIKADNILLSDNGEIKVSDFGFSAKADEKTKRKSFAGTSYWMAPEVAGGLGYGVKADIWSQGITAVEMADGNPPFSTLEPESAILKIAGLETRPDITSWTTRSPEFQEFLNSCLTVNVELRPTADELLKHSRFLATATKDASSVVARVREDRLNTTVKAKM